MVVGGYGLVESVVVMWFVGGCDVICWWMCWISADLWHWFGFNLGGIDWLMGL